MADLLLLLCLIIKVIKWCLNAECVSASFLGAGPDVKFGSKEAAGANEEEEEEEVIVGDVCYSDQDGSEYSCDHQCPSRDYTPEVDYIG
jgi:hypothetical protein